MKKKKGVEALRTNVMSEVLTDHGRASSGEFFRNTTRRLRCSAERSLKLTASDDSAAVRELVTSANDLLECGLDIFTGRYPTRPPISSDGFDVLPWDGEYWTDEVHEGCIQSRRTRDAREILDEIFSMAERVMDWTGKKSPVGDGGLVWIFAPKEYAVQAMAVQLIACADAALDAIRVRNYAKAGADITCAYKNLFRMDAECESLVRRASLRCSPEDTRVPPGPV